MLFFFLGGLHIEISATEKFGVVYGKSLKGDEQHLSETLITVLCDKILHERVREMETCWGSVLFPIMLLVHANSYAKMIE